MLTLGSRIRKVLPVVQPEVEKFLDLSIDNVEVLPYSSQIKEYSLRHSHLYNGKPFARAIVSFFTYLKFLGTELDMDESASAGFSTIYYSRHPLQSLIHFSRESVYHITAHELTHLAHFRILGLNQGNYLDEIKKRPDWIVEGFAEYVARNVVSGLVKKPFEKVCQTFAYPSSRIEFDRFLTEKGIKGNQGLVAIMKETC